MEHVTHQGESFFDFGSRIAIHCEFRDKRSNLSNGGRNRRSFDLFQLTPSLPANSSAWSLDLIVLELGLHLGTQRSTIRAQA